MHESMGCLSARDISAAVASGELSVLEVTEGCLARIHALNDTLNAVCTLDPTALDRARADVRLGSASLRWRKT